VVAPANRMAVDREEAPGAGVLAAWGLDAYPNPVRHVLRLSLETPAPGRTIVEVFDLLGRQVAVLDDGPLASGRHEFSLDVDEFPPGVYMARARSGARIITRVVTVIR
jgi:hypothetical protein